MGERLRPEIRQTPPGEGPRTVAAPAPPSSPATIGATLRAARESLGLSQSRLAELTAEHALSVSRSAICDIERGCNLPGIESLVSLCHVLHVDPFEILERVRLPVKIDAERLRQPLTELRKQAELLYWGGQYRTACAIYGAMVERLAADRSLDPEERGRQLAIVHMCRATAFKRMQNTRAAEVASKHAIHFAAELEFESNALVILASVHAAEGALSLAAAECDRGLRLAEAADSPVFVGRALLVRGAVLYHQARLDEAYEAFLRARDYSIQGGVLRDVTSIEGNIGTCLLDLGHPAAARRHYLTALGLARRSKDPAGEACWQIELGRSALFSDDLEEAERRAAAALRLARSADNPLTVFRGIWLEHRIVERQDPRDPDRQRLAYLKRLYPRISTNKTMDVVREFRREILGARSGESDA